MNQRQLDHAIARATGDDLATIRRRGFSILAAQPDALDWDELDETR